MSKAIDIAMFALACGVGIIIGASTGHADGYKAGQIDAVEGRLHWIKLPDEDGVPQWTHVGPTPLLMDFASPPPLGGTF